MMKKMIRVGVKSLEENNGCLEGICFKFVWFACRPAQIFLWVAKMTSFSMGLKRMLMVDDAYTSYLHTTKP